MKALRKVWRYLRRYKKFLVISLTMLILNQLLGLASPLIVKEILDEHLMGIEQPWYEVNTRDEHTVFFNGDYYKQGKYFSSSEAKGKEVTLFMETGKYYFVDEAVTKGERTISGETLRVENKEGIFDYDIQILEYQDVIDFYAPSKTILIILILLLLGRSVLSILVGYIQRISTAQININMTRDVRLDAVKKIQELPITYFEGEPAGKLANRIIYDVNGMMQMFGTVMNLVINASLSLVFAYIGMFILDPKLALFTFVVYPIVYFWLRFFVRQLRKVATKVNELNSQIVASLNEIINGISILKIFNYQKHTAKKFDTLNQDFMKEHISEVKLHLTLGWNMISFMRGIVTALIITYFGWGYLNVGGVIITGGLIYAYNEYLLKVVDPIAVLFREVGNLQHAIVRTERIMNLVDAEGEEGEKLILPRYQGNISIQNLWFGYNESEHVLKGINLEVKAGEMVGLVGHTGSGKSSLMSLLMRFYDMKPTDQGSIKIDGVDIHTYSKQTYRQHIGIILQEPILFKGTIASNIRFGKEYVSDEEIEAVMLQIGADKLLQKLEKGIHQEVSRAGSNLSVGEKQLISFARALIYDPAILIMDEATANIDTETETMIQKALEVVAKDRTMIIIAHRLSTIKHADKIVVLNNGMKLEEGSHEELVINNGVYANIYRSQVQLS
jgi:ATP-binding cassette, subfamily B, multidrug efflux pump